jgi:rhodanese-related sulfurtransferase
MRKLTALVLALAVTVAACGTAAEGTVTLVDAEASEQLIESTKDLVVLDVRTPEEVAAGALPGAINIDLSSPDFTRQVAELDRDVPYFVYCRSGNRSAQAVKIMRDIGFGEIYELDGGILDWAEAGGRLTIG